MPTMAEVRAKYPQYNDMSDEQLAGALHQKFYSDMPEEEFKAKIGLVPQPSAQPQQPATPGYGEDMLRAIPSKLRSGVEGLIGSIGSANQLTGQGAGWLAGKLGAGPQMQEFVRNVGRRANLMPFAPSTDEIAGATDAGVKAIPGSEDVQAATRYQPKTLPGKIVGTAVEMAPSMLAGPGGLLRKSVQTVGSAVGSELAGEATKGTKYEPLARVAGAVVGGGATAARNPKAAGNMTEDVLATMNKNKEDAYALSEKAGVIIKPQGIKHLADKVKDDLADFGYDPDLHPGAKVVLRKIEEKLGQNVTLKGLDTIRKTAGNAYIMGNKSNNAAVAKIVGHIDDFYRTQNPAYMAGISTKVGAQALDVARQFAHRSFKLEKALNLVKKGNLNADRNITDTRVKSVKEQLAKINDPFSSWGRGYNEAEKAAAGKASKYTVPQRMLHGASVLNPAAGGKLSAAGHLAMAGTNLMSGNILGLGLQAAGIGAGVGFQKAAEHLAAKSVKEFVDLVSRGGVPAPVVKTSLQLLPPLRRAAIIRALAAASSGQQVRLPLETAVGSPSGQ